MSIAFHPSSSARGAGRGERVIRRRRRMLATGFARLLAEAHRPSRGLSARVAVGRAQVLEAQADIEQLVARLRDQERPIDPERLEPARSLLRDGTGPVYAPSPPGTLRARVRVICEALE